MWHDFVSVCPRYIDETQQTIDLRGVLVALWVKKLMLLEKIFSLLKILANILSA